MNKQIKVNRKMEQILIACFLLLMLSNCSKEEILEVEIERIDQSIKSDSGKVIAEVYYDKPVVQGTSEVAEKMNTYFEKEAEGWLGGGNRLTFYREDWLDIFKENVEDGVEMFGEESLEESPFVYTADVKVALQDSKYLSILHITKCSMGGPIGVYYFGSTFDIKTGELIPFDKILEVDKMEFQDELLSYMKEKFKEWKNEEAWEEFYELYGTWSEDDYKLKYFDRTIQMNYEYFYDGKYLYIIFNQEVFNDSCIMKWNGKVGEEFEASLVGYLPDRDHNLVEYVY